MNPFDVGGLLMMFQSQGWLQLGCLILIVVVAVWQPRRIRRLTTLRRAALCLALAIAAPGILTSLLRTLSRYWEIGGELGADFILIAQSLSPVLTGAAVFLLARAVIPTFVPPEEPPEEAVLIEPPA